MKSLKSSTYIMGNNAEVRFENLCNINEWVHYDSTKHQDMHEHWDYLVNGKRVEVKSRKRARRQDSKPDDSIIYVEFKNVRGNAGWLEGKADYIAFERPEGFIMVKRSDLLLLANQLVSTTDWATRPSLYKSYHRRDRPDERVGVIKYTDLLKIDHKILPVAELTSKV